MTAVSPTTSLSTLDRSSAGSAAAVDFIFPCPLRSIAMSLAKSAYLADFTGNNQ
jgi:hypothetical protein